MSNKPMSATMPDAEHFAAPVCRNCGAERHTDFCGRCGQKRASRLDFGAVRSEAWQSYRVFEFGIVKAAWRLIRAPGTIALDYVLGARARHVHPLKLLLIVIGVQLLVIARTHALEAQNAQLNQAMALVQSWANWSFSLGIFAIVGASLLVLRWQRPFNLTEHLVLAVYAQVVVMIANVVNQLPVLLFRAPDWLAWHRQWSGWPMDAIEAAIVAFAFAQFFRLQPRRDLVRLALAALVFVGLKFLLLRLYSLLVIRVVMAQLA